MKIKILALLSLSLFLVACNGATDITVEENIDDVNNEIETIGEISDTEIDNLLDEALAE